MSNRIVSGVSLLWEIQECKDLQHDFNYVAVLLWGNHTLRYVGIQLCVISIRKRCINGNSGYVGLNPIFIKMSPVAAIVDELKHHIQISMTNNGQKPHHYANNMPTAMSDIAYCLKVKPSARISLYAAIVYADVSCERKLFQNDFSLRRRPSEISLFQRVETCLKIISKLFQNIIAAHEYFPTCLMSFE